MSETFIPLSGGGLHPQTEELLSLPVGTLIRHSYGIAIVHDVLLENAESFLQDVGSFTVLAGPEAYEHSPLITAHEDLPETGLLVLYTEGEPDSVISVEHIRGHFSGYSFAGRAIKLGGSHA